MLVAVLVPSGDTWHARFAISLLGAIHFFVQQGGGFVLKNKRGSILPQLREQMVEEILQDVPGLTHIFFADSDQTFPVETIWRLASHGKDFVAANIAIKRVPSYPTARRRVNGVYEPVFSRETSPALGEVNRIGLGIAMVRAEVFRKLPKPWFGIRWDEGVGDFVGEDWWFCERLEAAGIPILVDHRLSLAIGHIGSYEYTHGDVRS